MKRKSLLFILACMLVSGGILAQTGIITGKVIEAESGFEVIGGNVIIQGTTTGASTDLDGVYRFEAQPGIYTLECSYIGFDNYVLQDVEVKAGEVTRIDIQLGEAPIELGLDIVVTEKRLNSSEAAVLTIQKKAPVVVDVMSAAQISKSGDNSVAAAVKRVTGVTVEGGKYVYVRGLGDRYSKTTLNGATIPGLDPNKNTVQMDLFPTNLIDNILVYKTFSPNLPGDFTGGYIDISTKDFPSSKTININASVGYNTLATFNNSFLTYEGGSKDWIGIDDGTRALPDVVSNNSFPESVNGNSSSADLTLVAQGTRSFENNWELQNMTASPNYNLGFSIGNQKTLFGKELGYIAAINYQKSNEYYNNGTIGIYKLTGDYDSNNSLNTEFSTSDTRGTQKVLWGAMFNTSLKLNDKNKIGLSMMHNQSGTKVARFQEGRKQSDDPDDIYQTRALQFLQRGLSSAQLKGKHVFGNNNTEISWLSSAALSSQDEPDLRFFTNRIRPSGNQIIKPSSDRNPVRYYRSMSQINLDNKIDLTVPFNQWNGLSAQFKAGVGYLTKNRDFREERINFDHTSSFEYSGDITEYFSEANLIDYNNDQGLVDGVHMIDAYEAANNYDASQQVTSAYGMVELPLTQKLRAITGVRAESTGIQFFSFSEDVRTKFKDKDIDLDGEADIIDQFDILPSLNLNYEMTEDMKVRFAYNRTLARPTFRELAPFESFDFMGGFILIGNPELERTLIDNIDFRWEVFPNPKEVLSFSAFYKRFQNPIERTYNPEAPNGEFTWRNVEQAFLAGAEFEVKKSLGFISPSLNDFSMTANFTYIYSESEIDPQELEQIRATNPNADDTREMFGQSPYVINGLISYKNENGISANLSYNVSGAKIAFVTIGGTPNIYELPRHSLNFNIGKSFDSGFGVKLSANNLLNARFQQAIPFKGTDFMVQEYDMGMSFSLGLSYKIQ